MLGFPIPNKATNAAVINDVPWINRKNSFLQVAITWKPATFCGVTSTLALASRCLTSIFRCSFSQGDIQHVRGRSKPVCVGPVGHESVFNLAGSSLDPSCGG